MTAISAFILGLLIGASMGVFGLAICTRRCNCLPDDFRESDLDK